MLRKMAPSKKELNGYCLTCMQPWRRRTCLRTAGKLGVMWLYPAIEAVIGFKHIWKTYMEAIELAAGWSMDAPMVIERTVSLDYVISSWLSLRRRDCRHCDINSDGPQLPTRNWLNCSFCAIYSYGLHLGMTSELMQWATAENSPRSIGSWGPTQPAHN